MIPDQIFQQAVKSAETDTLGATNAPKEKGAKVKPLDEWTLGPLLDVALELRVISTAAQKFGHGVRDYRNLIHPGLETRSLHKIASQEADIAEKILEIVIRELEERKKHKN